MKGYVYLKRSKFRPEIIADKKDPRERKLFLVISSGWRQLTFYA